MLTLSVTVILSVMVKKLIAFVPVIVSAIVGLTFSMRVSAMRWS